MCAAVFALSQRGGYHFKCPFMWTNGLLPPQLEQLFKSGLVKSVHAITLGVDDSYFISYEGFNGINYIDSRDLPASLGQWLAEKEGHIFKRIFRNIQISLGPYNESFWATDKFSTCKLNLPPQLEKHIQEFSLPIGGSYYTPKLVLLGANGDFLLLTEDGRAEWKLGNYIALESYVKSLNQVAGGLKNIHSAVLNPYRLQCYVLQTTDGLVIGEVPDHAKQSFESVKAAWKGHAESEAMRMMMEAMQSGYH